MPEQLVGNADDRHLAKQPRVVKDFFNLGGADTVPGALELGIAAPDEVEESIGVHFYQVAGIIDLLDMTQLGGGEGIRSENPVGGLRLAPVPQRNRRAPVHQLADFPRGARLASVIDEIDLDVGQRLADGSCAAVDLLRRKEGGSERLGHSIHQVNPGLRQGGAQRPEDRLGKGGPRIRHVAQVRELVLVERGAFLGEKRPERRHSTHPADPLTEEKVDDFRGKAEPAQHEGCTVQEGAHELEQPVIETEREDAQDPVLGRIGQIAGAETSRGKDVAVREHHPFGAACRARGVNDGGKVDAQAKIPRRVVVLSGEDRREVEAAPALLGGPAGSPGQDEAQRVHGLEGLLQEPQAGGIGDDGRDAAIVQDVGDLRGKQKRVDGHEHRPGLEDSKNGDHLVDRFAEEGGHPVPAADAHLLQGVREAIGQRLHLGVGEFRRPLDERLAVWSALGLSLEQVLDEVVDRAPIERSHPRPHPRCSRYRPARARRRRTGWTKRRRQAAGPPLCGRPGRPSGGSSRSSPAGDPPL